MQIDGSHHRWFEDRGVPSRGGHPRLVRTDARTDPALGRSPGPVRRPPRRFQVFRSASAHPAASGSHPIQSSHARHRAEIRLRRGPAHQAAQRPGASQTVGATQIPTRCQMIDRTFSLTGQNRCTTTIGCNPRPVQVDWANQRSSGLLQHRHRSPSKPPYTY